MKTIPLTQGKIALVDDADFAWLSQWKWHACHSGRRNSTKWYARRNPPRPRPKSGGWIFMHHVILPLKDGEETDHIDGDGLNNQRANLRPSTHQQNSRNMKLSRRNKSGFKGVSFHRGRWRAVIGNAHLGNFDSPEAAAGRYDAVARRIYGEFARPNVEVAP